jgi:hypothetical protein
MALLFGNTVLLLVLHSTGTHLTNIISHINSSPICDLLSEGDCLIDRIEPVIEDGKIFVHGMHMYHSKLIYDTHTFPDKLAKIVQTCFDDHEDVAAIMMEVLKQSPTRDKSDESFEIHHIQHDAVITITSIVFSHVKTDKLWDLYFTTWGDRYIDVNLRVMRISRL